MTIAKANHRAARALMLQHLDLHPGRTSDADLDPLEAGIVGDTDHAEGGDSYHLGADQIRPRGNRNRYSVDESARDRAGLDNYASAMDYGYFNVTTPRGTFDLYDYNAWLIGLCRVGDPDTADLREVIYSPDGRTVRRWDDLGIRSTGDTSHLTHTHHSEYRDADGHRMLRLATRWLEHIGLIPEEDDVSAQDVITALNSEAGRAALSAWANSEGGRKALGLAVGRSDTVPRLLGDGTWAPATDANPTVGVASVLSFIHKDLWLVKRDLGNIKGGVTTTNQNVVAVAGKVGAAAEELTAFNAREAAEVPVTEERLVQLLDEAIPDHVGPLSPDEARAAVLGALRQAFAGPA